MSNDEAIKNKIKWNKLFAIFLTKNGISIPKFKKTDYGFRTYDNVWKLFKNTLQITKTTYEEIYNGYDYDKQLSESKYQVVIRDDLSGVDIRFVSKKIY